MLVEVKGICICFYDFYDDLMTKKQTTSNIQCTDFNEAEVNMGDNKQT